MADGSISGDSTSSRISSLLALSVGISIIVSAGALYGRYSQRWGPAVELVAAGSHLESMPTQIGSWQLVEETPMADSVQTMLECAGYINRRYLNRDTGQSVTVAIIVGPSGPTAVHTPEVCYSSRAYQIQGERKKVTVESAQGDSHSFWVVDFKTRDLMADQLRACYAWSLGDRWEASSSPRYEYGAAPMLYKIQLAGSINPRTINEDRDPCRLFFEDLVNSDWTIVAR